MIEVHPVKDGQVIKSMYEKDGLTCAEVSSAVAAYCDGEIVGSCLYDIGGGKMIIRAVHPENDIMLADGMIRSALHVGTENGVTSAFYGDTAPEKLFDKLRFIKNKETKEINISKLFESCCGCENN